MPPEQTRKRGREDLSLPCISRLIDRKAGEIGIDAQNTAHDVRQEEHSRPLDQQITSPSALPSRSCRATSNLSLSLPFQGGGWFVVSLCFVSSVNDARYVS